MLNSLDDKQKKELLVAVVLVVVLALYVRFKNAQATANGTTTGTGTGTGTVQTSASTGTDTSGISQGILDSINGIASNQTAQNTGLANLIQQSAKDTGTVLQTDNQSFVDAVTGNAAQNAAGNAQLNSALNGGFSGVQGGITATNNNINNVSDLLTNTLGAGFAGQTANTNQGFLGLGNSLSAGLAGAIATLENFVTQGFGELTNLSKQIISNQAGQSTALAALTSADYYKLGSSGLAACYDNNGISVNCAETQGRYEAGTNDTNQSWIINYLKTTYGSCLLNGKYDAVCVGKVIANNNQLGGGNPR
jgi:hypothetical protein